MKYYEIRSRYYVSAINSPTLHPLFEKYINLRCFTKKKKKKCLVDVFFLYESTKRNVLEIVSQLISRRDKKKCICYKLIQTRRKTINKSNLNATEKCLVMSEELESSRRSE